MITDCSHDVFPFGDQRCGPSVRGVLSQRELRAVTPYPEFIDGLPNRDLSLGSVHELLEVFRLFEHVGDRIDEIAEDHVVECDLSWHLEKRDHLPPVLFLERLSDTKLDQGPRLLVLFYLLQDEAADCCLGCLLDFLCKCKEEVLERKVFLLAVS